jgi:DNA-binding GntR family transcriptional regulator
VTKPIKSRRSAANLGTIIGLGGRPIRVQFKDGLICFRPHRGRTVSRLTLQDAYDSANGQHRLF